MSCVSCSYTPPEGCSPTDGCPEGQCPDITLRRNDTRPAFRVKIEDCDGPMDLTDLVLEASMWAKGKFKRAIDAEIEYFGLADEIGFEQIMVGDIIIVDRPRLPEKMLVLAFDETNKLVRVQRGYHGTTPQSWKKGTPIRIMKFMGATAQTEMVYQDIIQIDGTTATDQLTDSFFIYEWGENDTCLPGCYWLEFKLLKMTEEVSVSALADDDITPSFTDPNLTPSDFGCGLPSGVEWIRRFPLEEGFLVRIVDSPMTE